MASNDLKYNLDIETKQAKKGLDDTTKSAKELEKGLTDAGTKGNKSMGGLLQTTANLSLAYQGIIQVANQLTSAVGSYVSASNVQEKAERRLQNALKITGEVSNKAFEGLKKTASVIQEMTEYGDEGTLQMMQLGLSMGATADQIEEMTKGAIGLSSALGMDTNTAMKGVVLAMNEGEYTMLNRYIPALKGAKTEAEKFTILQKAMSDGFQLAIGDAETGAGAITQFSNIWGDLSEKIGDIVKLGLIPLLQTLQPVVNTISEFAGLLNETVTNTENVTLASQKERAEFQLLSSSFEDLTKKEKLSKEEKEYLKRSYDDLQKLYPKYLENITLEKDNYEEIQNALLLINKSLTEKARLLTKKAIEADAEEKLNTLFEAGIELIKKRQIATIKLKKLETERDEAVINGLDKASPKYLKYLADMGAQSDRIDINNRLLEENKKKQIAIT